jgi:hypothetical protein
MRRLPEDQANSYVATGDHMVLTAMTRENHQLSTLEEALVMQGTVEAILAP